eukprot:13181947-Ditylum_brightwellii.AAC.1
MGSRMVERLVGMPIQVQKAVQLLQAAASMVRRDGATPAATSSQTRRQVCKAPGDRLGEVSIEKSDKLGGQQVDETQGAIGHFIIVARQEVDGRGNGTGEQEVRSPS